MQQTSKYKLNKPGVDDPIAIVPLNENMDKLEGALTALEGSDAALSQRITVLEAGQLRIAVGSYTGDGSASKTISLGFTPKAVCLSSNRLNSNLDGMAVLGSPCLHSGKSVIEIVEGGFLLAQTSDSWTPLGNGSQYIFMAIG